jgi:tetratricopeptide (TPR) repeat protein
MNFDKAKAMRSAERFVAQGKLRNAIAEYRAVVDNDPRDIATLNMLGDLYAKNSQKSEAVKCYLRVAEHYHSQGFAQKAIAIYNKVTRIQPDSIEISAKLAELHRAKGSLNEARSHYVTLAEHYQKNGRQLEALAMFKQIALLDPNNTEVCLSLADSYLKEQQADEALEAYTEAAARFTRIGRHEDAIKALMKGYDINGSDLRILEGLVKAHNALGQETKGISLLEEILENDPFNREVLYLLTDSCLASENALGAEAAIVRLVAIEPANYPRFLELIRIYLKVDDPSSAARILNMSAEYLLAGGQSEECCKWITAILERDPNELTGLRLLARYNNWLNDENGTRLALERLYAAAAKAESVEDERFALVQLVGIRPNETRYKDRLNEINETYDFDEPEPMLPPPAVSAPVVTESAAQIHELETFHSNGHVPDSAIEAEIVNNLNDVVPDAAAEVTLGADELRLNKEIDSINFYIDNEYDDLAMKALSELVQEFGEREEFAQIRNRMNRHIDAVVSTETVNGNASTIGIDQMRSEFGLEDTDNESEDYDTHYHTAVAYQEMGLTEQAIAEFQDAINCTSPDDGTRRFFYCANMLGHCFLGNGRAKHAITWFTRALDTPKISDEEQHGIWYEIAQAHELLGEGDAAAKFFEQIYAENVDFRDVAARVKTTVGTH